MTALTNEVDYKHFDFFPENSPTSARRTASSPFAEVLFDRNLDRLSPSGFKSLHGRFRPQTPVQPPFAARISELGIPKKLFGGLSPYEKLGPGCPLDQAFKLLGEGYDGDEGYEPATGAGCPLEDAFPKFFAPPVIAKGTDKGLMLLCAYYFMKYGVDITVSSSYETFQEALKAPLYSPRARAWGIIATNGDNIRSHVTPVICFREKEGDPTQILQLDSIENPVLSVRETLRAMKYENPEVLIYEVRGSRQTDSFGCRNDALVVLKDALRILNEEAFTDLPNYLDLRKDYGPRYSFFIPAAWAKTVQDLSCVKQAHETPIFSKRGTLKAFFEHYYKSPTPSSISLFLPYNSYLNEKGKKLVEKIQEISSLKDPHLRRRFRHLEAFYMGPQIEESE